VYRLRCWFEPVLVAARASGIGLSVSTNTRAAVKHLRHPSSVRAHVWYAVQQTEWKKTVSTILCPLSLPFGHFFSAQGLQRTPHPLNFHQVFHPSQLSTICEECG
jgi:hypothetical protein